GEASSSHASQSRTGDSPSPVPQPLQFDAPSVAAATIATHDVPPADAVIAIAPPEVIVSPDGCTVRWTAGRGAWIGSVPWAQTLGSWAAPLQPACYYYEVTIVDMSPSGSVAVGLGPRSYNVSRPPGWDARSCALHSDDGVLFVESSNGRVAAQGFGL